MGENKPGNDFERLRKKYEDSQEERADDRNSVNKVLGGDDVEITAEELIEKDARNENSDRFYKNFPKKTEGSGPSEMQITIKAGDLVDWVMLSKLDRRKLINDVKRWSAGEKDDTRSIGYQNWSDEDFKVLLDKINDLFKKFNIVD